MRTSTALPPLRFSNLLSTAMDKTNAVTVWIMDVHFAIAPALISRFQINGDFAGLQFFMERIHIFDPQKDHSARHSITRKRGNVQLNIVTRQAHVTRIGTTKRSIGKSLSKTETVTVKLCRCG